MPARAGKEGKTHCGWRAGAVSASVVILRRRLKEGLAVAGRDERGSAAARLRRDRGGKRRSTNTACLSPRLDEEILTLAQLYRDRADSENPFDELKNQWGWGGFTTRDLARCQLMARFIALIYNWWNLFVRLAEPDRHLRRSPAGPSCFPLSRNGAAMPDRPRSELPARTPRPAGRRACSRASPASFASWSNLRSS